MRLQRVARNSGIKLISLSQYGIAVGLFREQIQLCVRQNHSHRMISYAMKDNFPEVKRGFRREKCGIFFEI